ncbi:helix-turn-helix domain-containing protein [Flavobacterium sp. DG1-102-2]|uniref:helix-turn-helix domain-containing protein n=1 Tax=Flavobacterium sp. DG1-102-2 TaxID=3081663 RepID=UPI00294A49E9|nr:helix-turn-helix domain-containing protein [Flavobacterium sp. DG1-102-2]MDV6167104.1 helix-turn-helix domain-containing protein [Flavobacterium sp. DG1-102-2]
MKPYTFDQLPKMISNLYAKMENIEKLLHELSGITVENDELLTITEASDILKLSVATIYSKVSRNELPYNKKGKRLYFYKSELTAWIKSGRISTNDELIKEK